MRVRTSVHGCERREALACIAQKNADAPEQTMESENDKEKKEVRTGAVVVVQCA